MSLNTISSLRNIDLSPNIPFDSIFDNVFYDCVISKDFSNALEGKRFVESLSKISLS